MQGLGGIRRRSKLLPSEWSLGGVEYIGLGDVGENMVLAEVDAEHNIMQYNTTFFISVNKQKYMFSITISKDISDTDKESSRQRETDVLVL